MLGKEEEARRKKEGERTWLFWAVERGRESSWRESIAGDSLEILGKGFPWRKRENKRPKRKKKNTKYLLGGGQTTKKRRRWGGGVHPSKAK